MTDLAIQKQIDAIKQAAKKATQTKETAIKFLIDAGIMPPPILKVKCDSKVAQHSSN